MSSNDFGFFMLIAMMVGLVMLAFWASERARDDEATVCRHAIQRHFHMEKAEVQQLIENQREWEAR
jgi:hypothetical protein